MGRPEDVRAQMESRQQKWLSERSAEEARREVAAELSSGKHGGSVIRARAPSRDGFAHGGAAPPSTPPAFAVRVAGTVYAAGDSSRGDGRGDANQAAANPAAHVVLDRITERLAGRMRAELVAELSRESARAAAAQREHSQRVESRLSAEVASHTCPICYELMAGAELSPILFVPCGHTLCKLCATKIGAPGLPGVPTGQSSRPCPVCRSPISSTAPNVSLRSIIMALLHTRDAMRSQSLQPQDGSELALSLSGLYAASGPPGSAAGREQTGYGQSGWEQSGGVREAVRRATAIDAEAAAEAARYASQYQSFCMRAAVLSHEAADTHQAAAATAAKAKSAEAVLRHLSGERAAAEERVRTAQREAHLITAQESEQAAKLGALRAAEAELLAQLELLQRTLQPLGLEADKARLLALNLDPGVVLDDGAGVPRGAAHY
ncbi:hypothetical protein T492DRAFT_945005 [Pavlovales sp. CCMP2436]|nr:hypothetical protein T492DRAFT_945005 [Pavlovales sp. CCMP2436]